MSRSVAEKLFSVFLLAITVGALWMTRNWSYKVYLFPRIVETGVLLLLLAHLALLFLRPSQDDEEERAVRAASPATAALERSRFLTMLAWLIGFVAFILVLGFPVGGTLATLVYLRWTAKEGWGVTVGLSLGVALFFWITAHPKLMAVPYRDGLITGYLPEWLWNVSWFP